ncbi:MAG: gliding motility-associated protein GldE [Alistipes sp.]|nr:gliding motility-associated protein GldE [Alistipes sp.]
MIVVAGVLLLFSAIASGSETALFSLTHNDIRNLRENSSPAGDAVLKLLGDADMLLATILVLNNLVNICIVILSSNIIDSLFTFTRFEFAFKTVLVTFLLLLFGEIIPKVLSQSRPARFALFVSRPLLLLERLLKPLSTVLVKTGGRIGSLAAHGSEISMDELADAVEMSTSESTQEHRILSGIVNLENTEVEEIMKPRVDITAVELTDTYTEVRKTIIESGFSRIPVYDDDLDNIKGTLYVKDLMPHIGAGDEFGWQKLIRKPYFVPKNKKINDLLSEFRADKIHMAIVVDEYGSTLGLVSLEDILEEVVGEISDESDADETFYTRLNENTYVFDGKTHIGDFERVLKLDEETLSDVKGRAETLAGLLLELKRDFPRKGDTIETHGMRFTVDKIDGHRVDKVKVVIDHA